MKYYAGIGSRETPDDILTLMTKIARALNSKGYTLRSGGAKGADTAFEKGSSRYQIFIPWNGFNGLNDYKNLGTGKDVIVASNQFNYDKACETVDQFHPAPHRLSNVAMKLHSRNAYQVLGTKLDKPTHSEFIICWTPDAKVTGGTGQAMRIANHYDIQILNLADPITVNKIRKRLAI